MGEFRMPILGADMTDGKVLEWRVKPGDAVRRGDVIAVIDTAKAEIDAEVFEDGVIEELLVPVGTRVPVGTVLATLAPAGAAGAAGAAGGAPAAPAAAASPAAPILPALPAVPAPAVNGTAPAAAAADRPRRRVSPLARRIAAAHGLDLAQVRGTGPHGAIGRDDVERALAAGRPLAPAAAAAPAPPPAAPPAPPPAAPPAPPPAAASPAREPDHLAGIMATTAALMARSKREVPHYYLSLDIDLHRAVAWMKRFNREHGIRERLVPAALLLTATARAAVELPDFNASWRDDRLEPAAAVHLGVAISLPGGAVIAPAILDAQAKGPAEMMAALGDLVRRARSGGLRAHELSDGTLTVTSLGDEAATSVFGVIYPPQVALVGFGRVAERPWAQDGMIGARPQVTATLSADHRASGGHRGSAFLAAIDRLLQRPEDL